MSPFSQQHVHMPYHELRIFPSPGAASLESPSKSPQKQRASPLKSKQLTTANHEALSSRRFLNSSIMARVSEKAAVPTVHFEDTVSRGGSSIGLSRDLEALRGCGSWKEAYNRRCEKEGEARHAKREREEYERRHYKPNVPDLTQSYAHIKIDEVTAPEPWQDVWGRNINCERCWEHCAPGASRVCCYTCAVVQHTMCTFGQTDVQAPALWLCDSCVRSLEDSVMTNKRQNAMKEFKRRQAMASVKCQSLVRMFCQRRFHLRFLAGIHRMQGICRGRHARAIFRTKQSQFWRPIKIRIIEAEAVIHQRERFTADKISNASVIVTLMNVEDEDIIKQDFRADTSLLPLEMDFEENAEASEVGWATFEETITVPCSQAHVNAVFTLTTTTPKVPNDADDAHTEFLGQATISLHDCLLYSHRFNEKELRLSSCETEPYEKGTTKPSRLYNLWNDAHGHMTVDIHPVSFTTSHTGYLDEVSNPYAKTASKKRWFCILVDGKMLIQASPLEPKPKQTRHMKDSIIKWHKLGVIEIQSGSEGTIMLTAPDMHDLRKWFSRLRVAAGTHPDPYPVRHLPKPVGPQQEENAQDDEGSPNGDSDMAAAGSIENK